ncbi:TPA: hypothetical protein N0F65_009128 [Lagenidium giganteum]|uniref:IQCH-like ATP-grasp domain-containing protein n=1 Tax=Lagenidium giganteum TaxID=4803 RepID=A0AAV2YRK9_9STRA|nr:TPA: hypothetical protein N0F65_009128 [Lagenidium giganteum]
MEQVEQQYHVEDVGRILLQTQEQLRQMREQFAAVAAQQQHQQLTYGGSVDVQAFQDIVQQAEQELRTKAELVLNGIVHNAAQAATLPSVVHTPMPGSLMGGNGPILAKRSRQLHRRDNTDDISMDYIRARFKPQTITTEAKLPSPLKQPKVGKVVRKRMVPPARLLPSVNKNDARAPMPELTALDARTGMLSLINRGFLPAGVDLTPAFAYGHGSVIKNASAKIHHRWEQPMHATPATNSSGFNIATLKFDLKPPQPAQSPQLRAPGVPESSSEEERSSGGAKTITLSWQGEGANNQERDPFLDSNRPSNNNGGSNNNALDDGDKTSAGDGNNSLEDLRQNVDKIRGYNELMDQYSLHQFIIHKGKALRETPEFVSFKRVAQEVWGSIEEVIKALEALLTRYFVPLAYIDGQRLLAVAGMQQSVFSAKELLSCIVNEDQVGALIRRPGQRYKGKDRKRRAAITIQAFLRMCMQRKKYNNFRRHDDSATFLQQIWRAYASHQALKRTLRAARAEKTEAWDAQMARLRSQWRTLKTQRRVVIHVPSISIDERSRLDMDNFVVRQNLQLSRLCGIMDPLVDIVYVAPFELSNDVTSYVMKMLQLGGIADPVARVKIVYPEHAQRFPSHFSLATLLLYSPLCLKRIKRYIRGKEAYLVTGVPGPEDKRLAITLGVPVLGVDAADVAPLLTRSGAKRLFMKADVNLPPGTYDIYDQDELLFSLAKLIISHLDQSHWILRLDFDPFSFGTALVDVSALQVLRDIRREKRTPEYWKQPGTRDTAARNIMGELERTLAQLIKPVYPELFPTWKAFVGAIAQYGVVIEAAPPNVVGLVRSNLFIEPTGEVHVVSTQDMLQSGGKATGMLKMRTVGYAFPQTLVPYEAVRGVSNAVGKVLFDANVIGYVSIDLVTFTEDRTQLQRLWAMALHPFLTDSAASFSSFHLLNRGALNARTGKYHLVFPATVAAPGGANTTSSASLSSHFSKSSAPGTVSSTDLVVHEASHSGITSLEKVGAERAYVVHDYVCHPNISTMQYSALFHTCRLHGVCFDVERSVGTVFLLADSLTAGVFGLMCLGETVSSAVNYLRTALEVIGREVGTQTLTDDFQDPTPNGYGNFAEILACIRHLSGGNNAKLEKLRRLRRN